MRRSTQSSKLVVLTFCRVREKALQVGIAGSNMATEKSIRCEESLEPDPSVRFEMTSDENLTLGLSNDSSENARLAAAFWEVVWPKLQEIGWEKRVCLRGVPQIFKLDE